MCKIELPFGSNKVCTKNNKVYTKSNRVFTKSNKVCTKSNKVCTKSNKVFTKGQVYTISRSSHPRRSHSDFSHLGSIGAADRAAERVGNREIVVLAAVDPDAILVAVFDGGLEEGGDVALRGIVAVLVEADALALIRGVGAADAVGPEVNAAADGLATSSAGDGQRVAVDERHVAIGRTRGGKVALHLGAAGARAGIGADEQGAAGRVAGRHAHLAVGELAKGAGGGAPRRLLAPTPVRVFRGELNAYLAHVRGLFEHRVDDRSVVCPVGSRLGVGRMLGELSSDGDFRMWHGKGRAGRGKEDEGGLIGRHVGERTETTKREARGDKQEERSKRREARGEKQEERSKRASLCFILFFVWFADGR